MNVLICAQRLHMNELLTIKKQCAEYTFAFSLALCLVLPLVACRAWAETSPISSEAADVKVEEIFGSLMSPFCPGKLLRDCTSSSAAELKQKVHQRLLKGESAEHITQSLLVLYGEEIRAAPRVRGFGATAWIAPFAFLALGGVIFFLWLASRRNREQSAIPAQSPPPIDSQMRERIDRAMRQE